MMNRRRRKIAKQCSRLCNYREREVFKEEVRAQSVTWEFVQKFGSILGFCIEEAGAYMYNDVLWESLPSISRDPVSVSVLNEVAAFTPWDLLKVPKSCGARVRKSFLCSKIFQNPMRISCNCEVVAFEGWAAA